MKRLLVALLVVCPVLLNLSCSDNDDNSPVASEVKFSTLSTPYLVCANRNPGGVGFDFEYKGNKGGANNLDSMTVSDFEYDVKIKTIKVEKPDGSLGGFPVVEMYSTVEAVNYSQIDTNCKGFEKYNALTNSNIKKFTLVKDDPNFDINSVSKGSTGSPLLQPLNNELKKLIIGQNWKDSAGNEVENDESIWIIKTREGKLVKFIVRDFPAAPAPTSTGYIAIEWDFVK